MSQLDAASPTSRMPKSISRLDILFFLLCTIVGFDTIGSTASKGAEGFTWLVVLGIVFFLPYALLTSELGSAFPVEGGAYNWVRLAFGRLAASVSVLFYWVSNPIWVGGSLAFIALAAFNTFFVRLHGWAAIVFELLFIWLAILAATVAVHAGKWLQTIGAVVRVVVLGFFTLSVIVYGAKHGVHGVAGSGFKPTYAGFIALVPILFFNYAGFEIPSNAGDEMDDPKTDVPKASLRGFLLSVLLYGGPILAILLVLPTDKVTSLGGFLDAIKQVFTVWGGHFSLAGAPQLTGFGLFMGWVAAIAVIIGVISSATAWLMGANRAYAVAAQNVAAPKLLGNLSVDGTPVNVNIVTGLLSTIVLFVATSFVGSSSEAYFNAVLGLAISTTTISYLLVFPSLYVLRRRQPEVARPYAVPGGDRGALLVSVLATFWAALATISLVWPGFGVGWFGTSGSPADVLDGLGFAGKRWSYELTQIVPIAIVTVLGVWFHFQGERRLRAQGLQEPPPFEGVSRVRLRSVLLPLFAGASVLIVACTAVVSSGKGSLLDRSSFVVVTDSNFPPASSRDARLGRWQGFDVDVAEAIAKKLDKTVIFESGQFDAVQSGDWNPKWDVSVGSMTITDQRKKNLTFTDPYYFGEAAVAVAAGSAITDLAGLNGKRIAVARGTTYESFLKGSLTIDGKPVTATLTTSDVLSYDTDETAIAAVAAGTADAVITAQPTIADAIDGGTKLRVVESRLFAEPLAIAVRTASRDTADVIKELDAALESLRNDGTLVRLSKQWFGRDLTTAS